MRNTSFFILLGLFFIIPLAFADVVTTTVTISTTITTSTNVTSTFTNYTSTTTVTNTTTTTISTYTNVTTTTTSTYYDLTYLQSIYSNNQWTQSSTTDFTSPTDNIYLSPKRNSLYIGNYAYVFYVDNSTHNLMVRYRTSYSAYSTPAIVAGSMPSTTRYSYSVFNINNTVFVMYYNYGGNHEYFYLKNGTANSGTGVITWGSTFLIKNIYAGIYGQLVFNGIFDFVETKNYLLVFYMNYIAIPDYGISARVLYKTDIDPAHSPQGERDIYGNGIVANFITSRYYPNGNYNTDAFQLVFPGWWIGMSTYKGLFTVTNVSKYASNVWDYTTDTKSTKLPNDGFETYAYSIDRFGNQITIVNNGGHLMHLWWDTGIFTGIAPTDDTYHLYNYNASSLTLSNTRDGMKLFFTTTDKELYVSTRLSNGSFSTPVLLYTGDSDNIMRAVTAPAQVTQNQKEYYTNPRNTYLNIPVSWRDEGMLTLFGNVPSIIDGKLCGDIVETNPNNTEVSKLTSIMCIGDFQTGAIINRTGFVIHNYTNPFMSAWATLSIYMGDDGAVISNEHPLKLVWQKTYEVRNNTNNLVVEWYPNLFIPDHNFVAVAFSSTEDIGMNTTTNLNTQYTVNQYAPTTISFIQSSNYKAMFYAYWYRQNVTFAGNNAFTVETTSFIPIPSQIQAFWISIGMPPQAGGFIILITGIIMLAIVVLTKGVDEPEKVIGILGINAILCASAVNLIPVEIGIAVMIFVAAYFAMKIYSRMAGGSGE